MEITIINMPRVNICRTYHSWYAHHLNKLGDANRESLPSVHEAVNIDNGWNFHTVGLRLIPQKSSIIPQITPIESPVIFNNLVSS